VDAVPGALAQEGGDDRHGRGVEGEADERLPALITRDAARVRPRVADGLRERLSGT